MKLAFTKFIEEFGNSYKLALSTISDKKSNINAHDSYSVTSVNNITVQSELHQREAINANESDIIERISQNFKNKFRDLLKKTNIIDKIDELEDILKRNPKHVNTNTNINTKTDLKSTANIKEILESYVVEDYNKLYEKIDKLYENVNKRNNKLKNEINILKSTIQSENTRLKENERIYGEIVDMYNKVNDEK